MIKALQQSKSVRPVLLLSKHDFGNKGTLELKGIYNLLASVMNVEKVQPHIGYVFTAGFNERFQKRDFIDFFSGIQAGITQEISEIVGGAAAIE